MALKERMDRFSQSVDRFKTRQRAVAPVIEISRHPAFLGELPFAQIGIRFNQIVSEFREKAREMTREAEREFREIARENTRESRENAQQFREIARSVKGACATRLATIAGMHRDRADQPERWLANREPH